jgi:hypothetical protein
MKKSIAKESSRRRIARRVGAAGVALAAAITLAACDGKGGGYINGPIPQTTNPVFNGRADFGFTFQCDAGVKGEITYHDTSTKVSPVSTVLFPGLRLHGTVTNVLVDTNPNDTIPAQPATTCDDVVETPWAQFQGTYRSQETKLLSKAPGVFTVVVFDQGEPGSSRDPIITGDFFSIDLKGGPYPAYTRAGYIEAGNIQVNNNNN